MTWFMVSENLFLIKPPENYHEMLKIILFEAS